ncbi:MAG: hypothetical protein D6798_09180 [Deltaproteobacteria bacterium]|nr:MAG: hypothetical protein D6798_09180 [Deltaproteobacteria bacterium]
MHRTRLPVLLCTTLLACGGARITGDLSDSGVADGGASDGGSAGDGGAPGDGGTTGDGGGDGGTIGDGGTTGDGGTAGDGGGDGGGLVGTDEDHDGWTVEAGDCDDTDENIHPYADDPCYDDIDANCEEDDEYDCDDDGYTSAEYGGDDCDDANDAIHPGAGDATPDGVDDDCDDELDEDVCNVYAPLANETGYRTYDTLFFDGETYTEQVEQAGWDAAAGTATVTRSLTGGMPLTMVITEYWQCHEDGHVTVSGYTTKAGSYGVGDINFSEPSQRLLPATEMVKGASWSTSYTATDTDTGDLWTVAADYTVEGTDSIDVAAGTFAVTVLQATYSITDLSGYVGDREGVVRYYLAPGIGVVYSIDTLSDATVAEERELIDYDGFLALDPASL